MDETMIARNQERIGVLKEAVDKQEQFCRGCRDQMLDELAEIRADIRLLQYSWNWETTWKHRVNGAVGGLLPAVGLLIYWIVKNIK